MNVIALVMIFIGIFLAGYNLGIKKGKKAGRQVGIFEGRLLLLEESMEKGRCLLCSAREVTSKEFKTSD